jgi:hypothetical protein
VPSKKHLLRLFEKRFERLGIIFSERMLPVELVESCKSPLDFYQK